MPRSPRVRNLVVVLGDQLDAGSAALDAFDKKRDAVWMAEVGGVVGQMDDGRIAGVSA